MPALARETLDYGSVMSVDGVERELKDDFDSFTPRFVFDWKPNDYSTIYASISTGTKPGNFNAEVAQMCESCIVEFEDEFGIGVAVPESEAVNYEAGYKFVTRNGKHRFNAAAFSSSGPTRPSPRPRRFDTNGDGEIDGTTISSTTRPLPVRCEIKGLEFFYSGWLGRFFNVSASYNYNDAKYVVFEEHRRTAMSSASRDASGQDDAAQPQELRQPSGVGFMLPVFGDLGVQRPRRLSLPRLVLHLGRQPGRDRRHQSHQSSDRFPQRPLGLLDLDEQRHRRRHPDGDPPVHRVGEFLRPTPGGADFPASRKPA